MYSVSDVPAVQLDHSLSHSLMSCVCVAVAQHIPCTFETMTSKSTAFNDISVSFSPLPHSTTTPTTSTLTDKISPAVSDAVSDAVSESVSRAVAVSPAKSFIEVFLPFSSNDKLRNMMLATDNKSVKLSRLLEMLDSMAGDVAMKHTSAKRTPKGLFNIALVTACVSGLSSCSRIDINRNYSLQGYVSYVGTSAMEVSIEIVQDPLSECEQSLSKIYFTMVALDPVTNKAVPVPQLVCDNERVRELYSVGKERAALKKLKSTHSLTLQGPRDDESLLIHSLYLDSVKLKEQMNEYHTRLAQQNSSKNHCSTTTSALMDPPNKNIKWVKHTKHTTALLMHSQNMNVNGKIFGGYIMRKSFEASHLSATLFYGTSDVQFSSVDDIQFVRPVHVGSVVEFVTHVVYSRRGYCVTHCNCYELDIVTNIRTLTNVLHYVFNVNGAVPSAHGDGDVSSEPVSGSGRNGVSEGGSDAVAARTFVEVIPREYKEILAYLEGKRTLDRVFSDDLK